ncbi:MAG TPA: hypothetical protein VF933_22155 [Streptosporangiaceae bacterium]
MAKAGLGVGGPSVNLAHEVLPGARPLSREDLSILTLENETVAGHACKVIRLDGPLALDALRISVAVRLPCAPGLSMPPDRVPAARLTRPAAVLDAGAAPGPIMVIL